MQGTTNKWLDTGNVEGGVDAAEGARQFETNSGGTDDSGDGKRSDEAGREFTGLGLEGKVLGGEPHLLPLAIKGGLGAVFVSLDLHPGRRAEECRACAFPSPAATPDVCLSRGDAHLPLLVWEQRWLIAKGALEGGPARGGCYMGVYGILSPG